MHRAANLWCMHKSRPVHLVHAACAPAALICVPQILPEFVKIQKMGQEMSAMRLNIIPERI